MSKRKTKLEPVVTLPATPEVRNRIKKHITIRAGDLVPHEANFRRHPDAQKAVLKDLYAEVGFARSLLGYELPDGRTKLIDGHLRQEIDPDMMVTVEVLDLNDDEARLMLATVDPLAALAQTDGPALEALLKDINTESDAVAKLLADLADLAAGAGIEQAVAPGGGGDDFDATPAETGPCRTVAGELWGITGNGLTHRLLVGDCTVPENVARLMGGEKIDTVVSDPPYGINFDTDYTRFTVRKHHNTNHGGKITGDERPFDPTPYLGNRAVVLWGANCFSSRLPLGSWLVWDKRFDNGKAWLADAEVAWMKGGHGVYIHKETSQGFVRPEKIEHPTQKPVSVMGWAIEKCKAGSIVYDPFLGSGTTLIAAHRLGRTCYGCEIDCRYSDVILKRAEAEGLTVSRLD